jgi:hypothetical protein
MSLGSDVRFGSVHLMTSDFNGDERAFHDLNILCVNV